MWLLLGAVGIVSIVTAAAYWSRETSPADPGNGEQVARGQELYERHCASCHGARLEGQPNWRIRQPNGRLPAPPHDDTGHTWHHPDQLLFDITRHGLVPPRAPQGYETDMPAYGKTLSDDEIWAALAYIKSRWSDRVLAARREMLTGRKR